MWTKNHNYECLLVTLRQWTKNQDEPEQNRHTNLVLVDFYTTDFLSKVLDYTASGRDSTIRKPINSVY